MKERFADSFKSVFGRNNPTIPQPKQRAQKKQSNTTLNSKVSHVRSFGRKSWRSIFHRRHDSAQFSGTENQTNSNEPGASDASVHETHTDVGDVAPRELHIPHPRETNLVTTPQDTSDAVPIDHESLVIDICHSNTTSFEEVSVSHVVPTFRTRVVEATADEGDDTEFLSTYTQSLTRDVLELLPEDFSVHDLEDDLLKESASFSDYVQTQSINPHNVEINKWIASIPIRVATEELLITEFTANDNVPSHDELHRRKFIKKLAYAAANGSCGAISHIRNLMDLHRYTIIDPEFDTVMESTNYSYRLKDLTSADWAWIYRAGLFQQYFKTLEDQSLDLDDLQYIFVQLLPDQNTKLLGREYFQVLIEGYMHKGILTHDDGNLIIRLQVYEKELHDYLGSRAEEAREPVTTFECLSMSGGAERTTMLRRLIEAVVYERKSWEGLYFEDAIYSFERYYEAFDLSESGERLPPEAATFYRDWSEKEQRMLRCCNMLVNILHRVKAGKVDYSIYAYIRTATAKFLVPGQAFMPDILDLRQFLETRYEDGGLAMSEIPEILIHHPEIDFLIKTGYYASVTQALESLVEANVVFQAEERQRYIDFERSVYEFSKISHSNHNWFMANAKKLVGH